MTMKYYTKKDYGFEFLRDLGFDLEELTGAIITITPMEMMIETEQLPKYIEKGSIKRRNRKRKLIKKNNMVMEDYTVKTTEEELEEIGKAIQDIGKNMRHSSDELKEEIAQITIDLKRIADYEE